MSQIIDGKNLAKNIRESLKDEVKELKNAEIYPKLAVIMVGDDKASKVYVKNKSKAYINTIDVPKLCKFRPNGVAIPK